MTYEEIEVIWLLDSHSEEVFTAIPCYRKPTQMTSPIEMKTNLIIDTEVSPGLIGLEVAQIKWVFQVASRTVMS